MWSSKKLDSIWQTVWAIKKAEIDPYKMYTILILRIRCIEVRLGSLQLRRCLGKNASVFYLLFNSA